MSATQGRIAGCSDPETLDGPTPPGSQKPIMGRTEQTVPEYLRGKPATWLERRMLEYASPGPFMLAVVATAACALGLWTHDWRTISGAALVALSSRIYCWARRPASTALEPDISATGAGNRRRPSRHAESSGKHRVGLLVGALSRYGRHGRARFAKQVKDPREREDS
jgi:hypothetical protein